MFHKFFQKLTIECSEKKTKAKEEKEKTRDNMLGHPEKFLKEIFQPHSNGVNFQV